LFGLVRIACNANLEWPMFFSLQWAAQSAEAYRLGWQWAMGMCETLEKGRFRWPQAGDAQAKCVDHEEIALLLGGSI